MSKIVIADCHAVALWINVSAKWLCNIMASAGGGEAITWAVAAQHPRLYEGGGDADVVEQTAVLTAALQPGPCDQHLHPALPHPTHTRQLSSGNPYTKFTALPYCWIKLCSHYNVEKDKSDYQLKLRCKRNKLNQV